MLQKVIEVYSSGESLCSGPRIPWHYDYEFVLLMYMATVMKCNSLQWLSRSVDQYVTDLVYP